MANFTTSPEAKILIDRQRDAERALRARLVSELGSPNAFLDQLQVLSFNKPDDHHLEGFYDLYQRCFPLEEEREPIEGFQKVLALNFDVNVQGMYGPAKEFILVAIYGDPGTVLGAANFIVMPYDMKLAAASGFEGSCQLNFLCVSPMFRGIGLAERLLGNVRAFTHSLLSKNSKVSNPSWFTTIEQNNPDRMTAQQIDNDAMSSLTDPIARCLWWAKMGFRRLAFDYTQPPLSKHHSPCTYIDYFAKIEVGGAPDWLPAEALLEHLRRFFFISVGKLEVDMNANPAWFNQRRSLQTVDVVRLA